MEMSRVFFDREAPLFYTIGDESFFGIEVQVDRSKAEFLAKLNTLVEQTRLSFLQETAPEDSNQRLSDLFIDEVTNIIEEMENG
jgi:hypothetical protein